MQIMPVAAASLMCGLILSDVFRLKYRVLLAPWSINGSVFLISERVRAMGVRPFFKHLSINGVNGPNMATVYSDRGFRFESAVVFYNSAMKAAALLKPGDFKLE